MGKTNLLPATPVGDAQVQVGMLRFACAVNGAASAGGAASKDGQLRLFFRPEAVIVRGVDAATANSAPAVVEKVEFLGAFSRVTFRLEGIDQALTADLSVNDMAEFHPAPGDRLRVAIPAERLRVFA